MRLPILRGTIERRILINYRVAPSVLANILPPPFRPKLHRGFAVAGICLIRLTEVRPDFMPSWLGMASENAAHRIAVQWDDDFQTQEGVFIRRRDTSSRLNAIAGGRVFPGLHSHARFTVNESDTHLEVALRSDDGVTDLAVVGDVAESLPDGSMFSSLAEASAFFEAGSLGYSATPSPMRFDGLELRCNGWQVTPLEVVSVRSSYFDDQDIFPSGSIAFDCALLMRNIQHEWHGKADLCCSLAQRPCEA